MKSVDLSYQNEVDKETEKVLKLPLHDFLKVKDYGTIETFSEGKQISIVFLHHRFSDSLHHIVFQAERKVLLFLSKKYLSGAKLENDILTRLNDGEIGNYD